VKAFLARFSAPATDKPRLSALPPALGLLIFVLCLLSLEIGEYWGSYSKRHEGTFSNLSIGLLLLLNSVAYSFQWSRIPTMCLRTLAWSWMLLVMILLFRP
jgi:hypothetical protein